MSWVEAYIARHGLEGAAAEELRSQEQGPLSGVGGSWLDDLAPAPAATEGSLQLVSLLGRGAIGEVHRAFDPRLGRHVACKVLRADRHDPAALDRFAREAKVLASLQHPAIPPVYDLGELPDGRPFVTMLEVRGRTLRQVALDHHLGQAPLTLRRRVTLLLRATEAAAHAHHQGLVHRDIKPSNIMVAPDGAVLLVDWGLAASLEGLGAEVVGTPGFMAPELARVAASPSSDVWALGRVLQGLVQPGSVDQALEVGAAPDGLGELLAGAMAPNPEDRIADGAALVEALQDWLDGAARLDRARELVVVAQGLQGESREHRAEAEAMASQAERAEHGVRPWESLDRKRQGWALRDRGEASLRQAEALAQRRVAVLEEALGLAPELPEALELLAEHYRQAHDTAREAGDVGAAAATLRRVERYDRGPLAPWLSGLGKLTVVTTPAGATVTLCGYHEVDRQLVPRVERVLGTTPLTVEHPHGAYLLLLEAPGHHPVRYPVRIERLQHWGGGLDESVSEVHLPTEKALGLGEIYVPGGPFVHGADGAGFQSLPKTTAALPGFVMQQHPVTHGAYRDFLNALLADGRGEEAHRWAPRDRGMEGSYYGLDDQGRYHFVPDADGDLYRPDWPAFFMSAAGAEAYAQWWSLHTGHRWHLPEELQHEKAARGSDGRVYPWGEFFDPTFACVRESHPGRPLPAGIHEFPADESVYGVRGLAGNMRTWCREAYAPPGGDVVPSQRVLRGGCFWFPARGAHGAARMGLDAERAGDTVGFRLVRQLT